MRKLSSIIGTSVLLGSLFPSFAFAASADCLSLTGKMRLFCDVTGTINIETKVRTIQQSAGRRSITIDECAGLSGTTRRECFVRIRRSQEPRFERAGADEVRVNYIRRQPSIKPTTALNSRAADDYRNMLLTCNDLRREARATCISETRREYFGR